MQLSLVPRPRHKVLLAVVRRQCFDLVISERKDLTVESQLLLPERLDLGSLLLAVTLTRRRRKRCLPTRDRRAASPPAATATASRCN